MSFIDKSEQNMKKYNSSFKEEEKSTLLLKEVTGGSVAGFVGGAGMGIDTLFAGPFHPDSGHGSKNKQLLAKQLKDRRKLRKDLTSDRDDVIDDYSGIPDPVGGYYETDTKFAELAYDELEVRNQMAKEYSDESTPPQDIDWKSSGWDYDYDENEIYIEEEDFINTSETNMEQVDTDIKYDENESYIEEEDFINTSETNMDYVNINLKYDNFDETMGRNIRNKMFQKVEKIIDEEEIQIDNKSFVEKSKTNIDKIIDEEAFIKHTGISLKTIYKNDIGLSIHIGD